MCVDHSSACQLKDKGCNFTHAQYTQNTNLERSVLLSRLLIRRVYMHHYNLKRGMIILRALSPAQQVAHQELEQESIHAPL